MYQGVVVTLAGPDSLEGIESRVAVVNIRLEDLPLDQLDGNNIAQGASNDRPHQVTDGSLLSVYLSLTRANVQPPLMRKVTMGACEISLEARYQGECAVEVGLCAT